MKMTDLPFLETPRLFLRLASPEDVPEIIRYYTANKEHLAPFEPARSDTFYTQEYWDTEVRDRVASFHSDRSLKLFLFERESSSEIVGSVNFSNFVRGVFQACSLGYSIAATKERQGYMTEALNVAINYVFSELNFYRITAAYLPENQRSGSLLKRFNFKVEGYAYDYLRIRDRWQDCILTSLINTNWHP